jgi:pyridoxamine 5'-phosphate oxidase
VDDWLESLPADPVVALARWLDEARTAGLHEPEAMALATATASAQPSVRMVLLRGIDERGLSFFTNYESRKAAELEANPHAAAALNWGPPLRRQARVEGPVERLTEEESLSYFRSRARESRLGAWASPQSRPLAGRDELDLRYADAEARFGGEDVPLPPFWGGFRLVPQAVELWQNRPNRLHDRARYVLGEEGWARVRLAP